MLYINNIIILKSDEKMIDLFDQINFVFTKFMHDLNLIIL